jgi:ABC-2 type transport system ATP-binding protein
MTELITLSARSLSRRYGKRDIVQNVSFELKRGEVLGLLGHNGAGKSTTLQMLTGVLTPNSGEIDICGFNLLRQPDQAKACIGYLPETPPLYREMRVDDFLLFAAKLHRVPKNLLAGSLAEAKQSCGLQDCGNKIIGTLSKGYQQRVGIAQAIIHHPQVIILDEPTVGLDPAQIRDIRTLIRKLGDSQSVILSTHRLSEVENICDRVEIMQKGRLIYGDSSAKMQVYGHQPGFVVTLLTPPPLNELNDIIGVEQVEALSATRFRILHAEDINTSAILLALAAERGWQPQQLTPLKGTIEDVYNRITENEPA